MTAGIRIALGSLLLAAPWALTHAQEFPTRPVKIIVGFPAGGTADAMPRIVAEKLSARWNQPVIVENRPGAGGNIGAEAMSRSPADGYTLMSSPVGPVAANAYLFRKLSYDPTRFVPISLLGTTISVLAVRNTLPARTVQELAELARSQPGKVTYASQGNGSTSHLTAAMFEKMANAKLVHVPYKGTAPALTDLMGGQVDMFFDNISSSMVQHRAGKVRILAVASLQRMPVLPDIPSLNEAGFPGFFSSSWNVITGPEGLPDAIAQQVSRATADALKLPDVAKKYAELGADTVGATPAETAKFIAEERARWSKVIIDAGVRAD
jgi:tripartite-type tricarboxylate transporter receptor subunit TctC